MQASLLSARLVYGLLLALFSAGGPSGEEVSVLVDQFRGAELVASYVVTEDAGALAIARFPESGVPESVALLDRVPGASHLYTELENERVYSLAAFFGEEYRLRRESELRLELPAYPEAMIRLAEAGGGGADTAADTDGADSAAEDAPGEDGPSENGPTESPESGGDASSPTGGGATTRRLAIAAGSLPREEWYFRRSGRLFYVRSAGADWLLVAKSNPVVTDRAASLRALCVTKGEK